MKMLTEDRRIDFVSQLKDNPEDRVNIFESRDLSVAAVVKTLKADNVALIQGVTFEAAETVLHGVARAFGLEANLNAPRESASHQRSIGKYFEPVASRNNYQFISPHCEAHFQIASFYCHQNSTDGGETLLFNLKRDSATWRRMKHVRMKVDALGHDLTQEEAEWLDRTFKTNSRKDRIEPDDYVLQEQDCPIEGVKVYMVLSKPKSFYSSILRDEVMPYWEDISNTDIDSGKEFIRIADSLSLMRHPESGLDPATMDYTSRWRVWRSGMIYEEFFEAAVLRRLLPGEFLILNNLTWAHAVTNWTPGSGERTLIASFV